MDGGSELKEGNPALKSDASLVRLRFDLATVFTGPGKYDFSMATRSIAVAKKYGKKVGLSFAGGTAWGSWIYDQGAGKHQVTTRKGVLTMPWPFDLVASNFFLQFIAAAGKQFDGDSTVGYVIVDNLGQVGSESFVIWNEAPPTEKAAFEAACVNDDNGQSVCGPDAWVWIGKKFGDAYNAAFPNTPFIVTADVPEAGADKQLDALCDYFGSHFPGHGGVGNASLALGFAQNTGFHPWQIVKRYAPTNPTMLQESRGLGDITQLLTDLRNAHVAIVEIYKGDFTSANSAAIKSFNAAAQ